MKRLAGRARLGCCRSSSGALRRPGTLRRQLARHHTAFTGYVRVCSPMSWAVTVLSLSRG